MFLISLNCQNWPPISSDLSLICYSFWGALQSTVQKHQLSESRPKQLLANAAAGDDRPRSNQLRYWPVEEVKKSLQRSQQIGTDILDH